MVTRAMAFKGKHKKDHYFEGWYYKCVSKDERHTVSFIPGISINKKHPHAFIQVIHNEAGRRVSTAYLPFDIEAFGYDFKKHMVIIDDNRFGLDVIDVRHESDDIQMRGTLRMTETTPIQTCVSSPSIMGWFAYLPFMECNHDVVSMDHFLFGSLDLDGTTIDFNGGKGYMEKDYGRSFPEAYVWMQSNHFGRKKTSFMFSYATIPYLGFRFKGFIANLVIHGNEYRFATYNRAKMTIRTHTQDHFGFELKKGKRRLVVDARNHTTAELASPRNGMMEETIKEGLSGTLELTFYENDRVIFSGTGEHAGLEIMLDD